MSTSTRPQGDPDGLMVWADVVVMAVGKIIVAAAVGLWWLLRHRPRSVLLGVVSAAVLFGVYSGPVGWAWIAAGLVGLFLWRVAHEESFAFVTRPPKAKDEPPPALDIPALMPGPIVRPLPPPITAKWIDPAGLERLVVGTRLGYVDVEEGTGKLTLIPDGTPWTLDILRWHTLLAGKSGSGKSRLSWSVLAALGPHVNCGGVEVWAIDPKGGLEIGVGVDLFKEFAHDPDDEDADYGWEKPAADLLQKARVKMRQRTRVMRANKLTQHVATPGNPHVVIWFDELASIYGLDAKDRNAIMEPLRIIMETGRAAGFSVIGCIQDPRAETLKFRPLFTSAVGLRLPGSIIDGVLEDGAREAGARCDKLHKKLERGCAYIMEEGVAVKVKSYLLSDPDVEKIAAMYGRDD